MILSFGAVKQFHEQGVLIVPGVLNAPTVTELQAAIAAVPMGEEVRRKRSVYGVRNLLEISPRIRQLAASPELHGLVSSILGERAFATRAVFFDKVPDANWTLGWHQDSVISVAGRIDVPGFTAWGKKRAFGRFNRHRTFWAACWLSAFTSTIAVLRTAHCECCLARIDTVGSRTIWRGGKKPSPSWFAQ